VSGANEEIRLPVRLSKILRRERLEHSRRGGADRDDSLPLLLRPASADAAAAVTLNASASTRCSSTSSTRTGLNVP
jgi:hypothetical protein